MVNTLIISAHPYNYLVCVINLNMPVDKDFVNRFTEQDEIYADQVRALCQ